MARSWLTDTLGPNSRPNTRSARVIVGPSASAAARSTTLRISRTLPGHEWLIIAPIASWLHDIVMPRREATSRKK